MALGQGANYTTLILEPTGDAAQDTPNLAEAINSIIDNNRRGGTLQLAQGDFFLNAPLTISNVQYLRLFGTGRTRLIWRGGASDPVILLNHARECVLDQFRVEAAGAYAGIRCMRDSGAGFAPTKNRFQNLHIFNADYGIALGGPENVDSNNDFNYFENVLCQNYTTAGYWFDGTQSYNNMLVNCHALGDGINSQYGVTTGLAGGSFSWRGGSLGDHLAADFGLGRSYQPYEITGINSERSARLLERFGVPYSQIRISNSRWSGSNLHADGYAIKSDGLIQLRIEQCSIGDGPNPTKALQFAFNYGNPTIESASYVECVGTRIYSSAVTIWPTAPNLQIGNIQITDESQSIYQPVI